MIVGVLSGAPIGHEGDDATWLRGLQASWSIRGDGLNVGAPLCSASALPLLGHTGAGLEGLTCVRPNLVVLGEPRVKAREASDLAARIADAYAAHGLGLLPQLRHWGVSDAAFALYDAKAHILLAASTLTSRLPFSYWSDGATLAFATRALPVLRYARAPRALDEVYLSHILLGSQGVPPGLTPFRGIRRLEAGEGLVVRDGRVTTLRLDRLRPVPSPPRATAREEAQRVWVALGDAVARSVAASSAPCLSLSGGLDSAALIAAAVAQSLPLPSLAMVAPELGPGIDEEAPIRALEVAFPQVDVRRVDVSHDHVFPDLDAYEARDDPPMTPLSLFGARLTLWRAASARGFRTVLDGEGGDELFSVFVTAVDALRRGDAPLLFRALRHPPGRRNMVTLALALPLLPEVVQRRWAAGRAKEGAHLPPYLSARGAIERARVDEASQQFFASWIRKPAVESFGDWLSRPTSVGPASAHDRFAGAHGVSLASPLLDQDFVEVALGLSPAHVLVGAKEKRFLREVLLGRIPEAVRALPKHGALPGALLPAILTSQRSRMALRHRLVRDRLAAWVRFEKLDDLLDAISNGYVPGDWLLWQLESVVSFAEWYSRVAADYGVY